MDKDLNLLPMGVAGELCVGGAGVVRGYLNRPELSEEKFIQNPYKPEERIYRSGDLARLLPNGEIEYLGRIDRQVKIRGFRIELGEIEEQLLKKTEIKDAVVLDREDAEGEKYLCAYLLTQKEVSTSECREYLSKSLPKYMIPAYFITLDKMPLTLNGKIDRKALPDPTELNVGERVKPRNSTEEKLLEIWQIILNRENIGVTDDFFEIGGHSLKATRLMSYILKDMNVELKLMEIFEKSTIAELAEIIDTKENIVYDSIKPIGEQDYYPVSSAQKRLIVLHQFDKDSLSYNMPFSVIIKGRLDQKLLENALKLLIERHESFRTFFEIVEGEPVQRIQQEINFRMDYLETEEEKLKDVINDFIKPFDLSNAPLLRVGLVNFGEEHLLMMDMHHIISDGVSIQIFFNELIKLYQGEELPDLRIQYKDFAVWQNQFLQSERMKKQEEYWLESFVDEIPILNLPYDYPRPSVMSFEGDRYAFRIEQELSEQLKEFAQQNNSTLFMILLASYNLLLSKYSGQDDIIVGSPIAGRPHADLENILGMFVNTLALRNKPDGNKTFTEFLAEVRENALQAYENQDYQFEMLVDKLKLQRDISRNPLFDTVFALENMDASEIHLSNVKFIPYKYDFKIAKFDLQLVLSETQYGFNCDLEYNTRLFKHETVERMASHYANLLTKIVMNPESKISEIDMLSTEEKAEILVNFNQTRTDYPADKTIQQLFAEQVLKTPEKVAVTFDDQQLTFEELNAKSNQLARILRERGVERDKIVGLIADRSLEMIIGILSILKAGGAYLPIDPEYPEARIDFMLKDSNTQIMLVQENLIERFKFISVQLLNLNDDKLYAGNPTNLKNINTTTDLAYVIYTSGTTGKPKGNLTLHYNISRVVLNTNYIEIIPEDNVLQLSNYAFDGSTFDIYAALLNGATLVMIDKETILEPAKLANFIQVKNITIFFVTTALFNTLVEINLECFANVRRVLFGGERVSIEHVKKALDYLGEDKIIHVYGPTETTVFATYYLVNSINENRVPIGSPLSNMKIYILDKNNNPQPIGIPGEICIAGAGVARGYLNRPDFTTEKFVENPFTHGEKMYRSGDLGKWLLDGNIEFLGRLDHQVKIRGFRIELGEIESQLLSHPEVKEAIVIDYQETEEDKYLCAYLVSDIELDVSDIRNYLTEIMPKYMIPDYLLVLDKMPLTSNGKIDRKALPNPIEMDREEIIAPRNGIEEKILIIWQKVLKHKKISVTDNFFDMGGHSLKATRLMAMIHEEMNVELSLIEIFKNSTIAELAKIIASKEESIYSYIEPVNERDYYPVSSAQKRLFVLHQLDKDNLSYNMPYIQIVEGNLEQELLENVLNTLIKRHEILRTSFETLDGEPIQIINQKIDFKMNYLEVKEEELSDVIGKFIKPFDLSKAPLFRAQLVKFDNRHMIMLDMHHIISDGVSTNIFFSELIKLYQGDKLPNLRIQYKDFAVWQNEFLNSERMKKQEKYWLENFSDEIPVLNLPYDSPRPSVISFNGDRFNFWLEKELSLQLNEFARQNNATLFMTLLAAYNLLLSKYSGQEDIIVGSPIAGRSHADLENILGMFANTLALRNKPKGSKTFIEFLAEIKENALQSYENQDYQFEILVDKLNLQRDTSRNPLFDTVFVLENMRVSEVKFSDMKFKPYEYDFKIAKFDLRLAINEIKQGCVCDLEYNTNLFKRETVERMANHYVNLLMEIVQNSERKLSDINMLSLEEREEYLFKFNQTQADRHYDKTIQQLFVEQVKTTPERIAVIFEDQKLTYEELNVKSNQIARVLKDHGVERDKIVGLLTEGSLEMLIGIMGILKAGGAYLPVDPEYPEERIKYIFEDSKTELCLTQSHLIDKVNFAGEMIDLQNQKLYIGDDSDLEIINKPEDLVYLIYTSGSTGNPKAVMIEHRGLVNYAKWASKVYVQEEECDFPLYSSLSFDLTVTSIYVPLITGNKIIIYGSQEKELLISRIIKDDQVHIIKLTPAHLQIIKEMNITSSKIKRFIVGGEELTRELAYAIYRKFDQKIELYNEYGPTETVVGCMIHRFNVDEDVRASVPIGVPADNTQIYLLDKYQQPVSMGVLGEIYISGDGVARGYLNKEDLTKERFVENPFIDGKRMYKTGDLARRVTDGKIEFVGRIDHQVKIRGYRIELGEIESQLSTIEGVKEVLVIDREDSQGEKYLCAYLVISEDLEFEEIKGKPENNLPDYMIPAYYTKLNKMPLTKNGKIDLKALPDPTKIDSERYVAPRNVIEEQLFEIWKEALGREEFGVTDNFFEMGGHSLKATRLMALIYKKMNVELSLMEIFKKPTIAELAEIIGIKEESIYASIEPIEEQAYYPVSSAQKRLFVLNQLDENSISYNVPFVQTIKGELNQELLENALRELIQRHEILKTSFEIINGEPVQRIHQEIDFEMNYLVVAEEELKNYIKEFIKPFDLSKAPLFRVQLIRVEDRHLFMMDMHHIIADGVSMEIIFDELLKLYQGYELPDLRIQYKDFAVWQNHFLQSEKMQQQEKYWLEKFAEEISILDLPYDYQRPSIMSFDGDRYIFGIEPELSDQLNELAHKNDATLFMVLLAAYNLLLSKYSGQENIIVGTPIAGRPHADLENILGMFANTLALRNKPEGNKVFTEFLEEVRENALEGYENQDYQFEMLVNKLELQRDTSRNPLFDTVFVLQNMSSTEIKLPDVKFIPYRYDFKIAKFDLRLAVGETPYGLSCDLEYNTKLFKRETAERMSVHYVNILKEIIQNTESKLSDLDILSLEERKGYLYDFNQTHADYTNDKTIHQLFTEQVAKTPDQVAVIFEDQQLIYGELHAKSNQLARVLRERGIKRDQIVGLMADRSLEMIIAILGILKARGAYLPIDPEYPEERIRYMIENSNTGLCLTQTNLLDRVNFVGEIIDLQDQTLYAGDDFDLEVINKPEDLVYIIYTSGSTGNPKGVMIEHRGLVNYVTWASKVYVQGEDCDFPLYSSLSFDLTVTSIYVPLITGNKVVIYGAEEKELLISKIIKDDQVQIIKLTPAHLQIIKEMDITSSKIKRFIVGGEELTRELVNEIYHKFDQKIEIYNEYGPTETVVGCMIHRYDVENDIRVSIPIGVPADNVQIYLLDQYQQPVAVGIPGEIYISGDGVARGYLNSEDLTAERFALNPFIPGQRMYRTGDLARRLPARRLADGKIEFIGRIDHQVKIRGYRIELGEIESQLLTQDGIKEALVIDRADYDGEKYLCAYLVTDEEVEVNQVKEQLSINLPDYMIPTYFIELDKMPLTPNGKIDTRALPDSIEMNNETYVAPRNAVEEKLLEIWKEVLGRVELGVMDNFFEMGGHSLKATRLMALIYKEMNIELSLMEIFEKPTIAELAEVMGGKKESVYDSIQPVEEKEYYPVSSAQKRLYVLNKLDETSISYNVPFMLMIEGELNQELLEKALKTMIERHEIFRTSFEMIDGEPVQKIHQDVDFSIHYLEAYEANEEELKNISQEFIKPFDLSKAPLCRVQLIKIKDKHLFMLDVHHIITDGVSTDIFFDELIKLYMGNEVADLRIQYKDFAVWQNEFLQSEEMEKQEEYWLNKFADEISVLNLSYDYPRPSIMSFEGDHCGFWIEQELSEQLNELARQNNATLFIIMLAVYDILLSKYSGQEDIIVGSPIAGRPSCGSG